MIPFTFKAFTADLFIKSTNTNYIEGVKREDFVSLLRCTVAGLIPLMMTKKYSCFSEEFYRAQKVDFDKIIKTKSYFLLRDLPFEIASRILLPETSLILSRQKSNGLWQNSPKVTYDILSALKHIQALDDLISSFLLENVAEKLAGKYDYYSLLIKSIICRCITKNDVEEINKLIRYIQGTQNENGSWENTVVATIHNLEKLHNLGVSFQNNSVQKAITFIFQNLNLMWPALQSSGREYGLQSQYVFSTEARDQEFEAAQKYKEEMVPKLICYRHVGIMQNSLSLKLLLQLGFEEDKRVESAIDNLYSMYKSYNSLCYFTIQKKFIARQKKTRKLRKT